MHGDRYDPGSELNRSVDARQEFAGAWTPLIVTVAPTGARKTRADHPELPITPAELAQCAAACQEAGAAMIHLHVRDENGEHSLDHDRYKAATDAIRARLGDRIVIQVTTESVGRYTTAEQMALLKTLVPEAASLAVREFIPEGADEGAARDFFAWLREAPIQPQFILYDAADLRRLRDLGRRGILWPGPKSVLFVLGRYAKDQQSDPRDLVPFLAEEADGHLWSLCAFGYKEAACGMAAASMGGHLRVGFENNLMMADGQVAPDNAALVVQQAVSARQMGRPMASAAQARELFSQL